MDAFGSFYGNGMPKDFHGRWLSSNRPSVDNILRLNPCSLTAQDAASWSSKHGAEIIVAKGCLSVSARAERYHEIQIASA